MALIESGILPPTQVGATIDLSPSRAAAPSAWSSLRLQLPLLISGIVVVAITTVLALAYREVEADLLQAAGARAQVAADQFANLLSRSSLQRLTEIRRVARTTAIRVYLEHPSDQTREAARMALASLTASSPQIVVLWNMAGENVLAIESPAASASGLPIGAPPVRGGHGPFQVSGDVVYADVAAFVTLGTPTEPDPPASSRLGVLVVRRPVAVAQTADVLNNLIGNGALVKVGNREGDVWTDLDHVVPAPPLTPGRTGVVQYRASDGQAELGAPADIRGTPWAVWIEFPRSLVLASAHTFLKRMAIFALCVVIAAGIFGLVLSRRITAPLRQFTNASEAIAAGEYSRRVVADRRDEVGRLGAAFNMMADQVERAHRELEDRVQRRTVRLTEASALLEQRVRDLNQVRAELDQFFSLSPELFGIADSDGRFTRVNQAWRDVLGWTEEELTSTPYVEFVHPDDRAATLAELEKKVVGGEITQNFENRYRCRDGSYRWLSWRSAPLPGRSHICATARDVTEEKRTAQEIQDHATQLAALNHELEAFSYSVSHDLRAPLRHINGFAMLFKDAVGTALDTKAQQYLDRILSAASRMGTLIDDLLALSRNSRTNLSRSTVNLAQLMRDAQQEVTAGINDREITWTVRDLPTVQGDPSLLRLVFVNLLSNAVKYSATRSRSEIEVGTLDDDSGHENVVFIRDNGVGFDMQYADRLFGVFQRLHNGEQFEGTGIGLANVRRIIQRHGGRTWAESMVDCGATFYVALPN